jgi:L-iditol 2-dehydrogenase
MYSEGKEQLVKISSYAGARKDYVQGGGGTIGLFTLQWARIFGAKTVTVFDIDEARLKFIKDYGADYTINTKDSDGYEASMEITGGSGFDFVFETAGQPATMNLAFRIAAVKSSVCFIGTPHTDLTFPPLTWELMNRKEFRLSGSWMSYSAPYPGKEWSLVAHFLAKGELRIGDDLIYKTYPLSEGREAFMNFKDGPIRGKVILTN